MIESSLACLRLKPGIRVGIESRGVQTIDLDEIDFRILDALRNNARLSNKELAAKAGLSPSSCLARVQKLVRLKVIQGFQTEINLKALGIGLQAIVSVRFAKHSQAHLKSFYAYIRQFREVLQIFEVTGANDFLIHVAVADVDHLRDLVVGRLSARPEVAHCETSVVWRREALPGPSRGGLPPPQIVSTT